MTRLLFFLAAWLSVAPVWCASMRHVASFSSAQGLGSAYITAMAEDHMGLLWAGTEQGLWLVDGYEARMPFYADKALGAQLTGNGIAALKWEQKAKRLWIGTRHRGLFSYDPVTGAVRQWTEVGAREITGIALMGGAVWIASMDKGLWQLLPATAKARAVATAAGRQASQSVTSIEVVGDMLYMGSYNGLLRLNPATGEKWLYGTKDGLPHEIVYCVRAAGTGRLAVGTAGGAVLWLTAKACATKLMEAVNVRALAADAARNLWIGTEGDGLWTLTPNGGKAQRVSTSNKTVKSLFCNSRGQLCVGTYGDGIDIMSPREPLSTIYTPLSQPVAIPQKEVLALAASHTQGELWVGMDGAGLAVIEPGGTLRRYTTANSALTDGAILAACRGARFHGAERHRRGRSD